MRIFWNDKKLNRFRMQEENKENKNNNRKYCITNKRSESEILRMKSLFIPYFFFYYCHFRRRSITKGKFLPTSIFAHWNSLHNSPNRDVCHRLLHIYKFCSNALVVFGYHRSIHLSESIDPFVHNA